MEEDLELLRSRGPSSGRFGFWFGREGFAQKDVKFPNAQLVVALRLPFQNLTSFPLSHSRGRRKGWAFMHLHYWASGKVAQ